jgi:uncharacterized protein (DUF1330 family)
LPVDPTGDDIKRYLAEDAEGPVVMLNLLRFREGPDARASYEEYGRRVQPFLEEVGASAIYVGECSTAVVAPAAGWDWDMVLLARYPSRKAFLQMVANPAYQEITSLRTQALSEAVLQATTPLSP